MKTPQAALGGVVGGLAAGVATALVAGPFSALVTPFGLIGAAVAGYYAGGRSTGAAAVGAGAMVATEVVYRLARGSAPPPQVTAPVESPVLADNGRAPEPMAGAYLWGKS